jgi:hypothetical protein
MIDLWAYGLFSLVVVTAAVGMCVWHVRVWRACEAGEGDGAERDFRRRQFRRRIQASVMLGLLGLSVSAGGLMMFWRLNPTAITLYWYAVIVMLAWLALLALADLVATRYYYRRVQDRYTVEHARLKMELRRLRALDDNRHSGAEEGRGPDEN